MSLIAIYHELWSEFGSLSFTDVNNLFMTCQAIRYHKLSMALYQINRQLREIIPCDFSITIYHKYLYSLSFDSDLAYSYKDIEVMVNNSIVENEIILVQMKHINKILRFTSSEAVERSLNVILYDILLLYPPVMLVIDESNTIYSAGVKDTYRWLDIEYSFRPDKLKKTIFDLNDHLTCLIRDTTGRADDHIMDKKLLDDWLTNQGISFDP